MVSVQKGLDAYTQNPNGIKGVREVFAVAVGMTLSKYKHYLEHSTSYLTRYKRSKIGHDLESEAKRRIDHVVNKMTNRGDFQVIADVEELLLHTQLEFGHIMAEGLVYVPMNIEATGEIQDQRSKIREELSCQIKRAHTLLTGEYELGKKHTVPNFTDSTNLEAMQNQVNELYDKEFAELRKVCLNCNSIIFIW